MKKGDMKIGVFTVSTPDYDPAEAMEVLAKMGYEGVEWRITSDSGDKAKPSFWSGNRTTMTADQLIANAGTLKKQAKALGMAMPSLGTYIDCYDMAVVELNMRATAAIGAKCLRISPGRYDRSKGTYAELLARAQKTYAVTADLAARYKVRALIETHMGLVTPTVATAMQVLNGLNPKHVGIMWDPGNQVMEGAEVYSMALDIAGEYLAEVHAKNMKYVLKETKRGQSVLAATACPVHEGVVNWPAVIDELVKIGYKGWIFLEDFSTEQPLKERLEKNLAFFRSLLPA